MLALTDAAGVSLETATLGVCEGVIQEGLTAFVRVGQALLMIRDGQLYKEAGYETFQDYCRERWNLSLPHSAYLVRASEAVGLLPDEVPQPIKPAHAEPLSKLRQFGPEAVEEAWSGALVAAGGDVASVTADIVTTQVNLSLLKKQRPRLVTLVAEGVLSVNEAWALHKVLTTNPDCAIFFEQGLHSAAALKMIASWGRTFGDEVESMAVTGFLQNGVEAIPVARLTPEKLQTHFAKMYAEKMRAEDEVLLSKKPLKLVYFDQRPVDQRHICVGSIWADGLADEELAFLRKKINDIVLEHNRVTAR